MALPAGPRLPLLQTLAYLRDPYTLLRRCARRHGDVFTVRTARLCVMTGQPELVREILSAPVDQYGAVRERGPERVLGRNGMAQLAGRALRRDRRLVVPQFQGEALVPLAGMIRQAALDALNGWQPGATFTMREAALEIALDVILRTVFGADTAERRAVFRSAIRDFTAGLGDKAFLVLAALGIEADWLPPNRRFRERRERLEAALQDAIDRARQSTAPPADILGRLVAARREDGSAMPDPALRDNLITVLIAGHETSALSLCWLFYWLHSDRNRLARVLAELEPLGPDADPAGYAALPYLDAVAKETLRLWPAVSDINRILAQPMTLGGWELPAGTTVAAATAILHYDETLYPEPETFRPERFLERRFAGHEYMPFGGGERMCPGAQFSLFEMKIVLGTLLTHGRFTLLDRGEPVVKRIGFLMGPKSGVRLRYDGPLR
jgi:cytochrome P450